MNNKSGNHSSTDDRPNNTKRKIVGRESWSTYIGFIFAAVGSTIGIEDIWRFPYVVGGHQGGTFLIPYITILCTFGLFLMMLELAIGRYFKTSVVNSLASIRSKFRYAGIGIVSVTIILLSYYIVVVGWVLALLIISIVNSAAPEATGSAGDYPYPSLNFDSFSNSLYPIGSFLFILLINCVIIARGIKAGIEKVNEIGVIILLCTIIPLTIFTIFLPGAEEGIQFYLVPNIHSLADPNLWISAFGQAFFSLSVGLGILLTYGSYLREKKSIINSSLIIIFSDIFIVIIIGLMIFSITFASNLNPSQGPSLAFNVLPLIFSHILFGGLIASLFFILFLMAGITSTIAYFQVPVAMLEDTFGLSRSKSVILIAFVVAAIGLPSALSYSSVHLTLFNIRILDLMDKAFGTYGISITAALFVILVTWFMDNRKIIDEINRYSSLELPYWTMTIAKYAIPSIIVLVTILDQLTIIKFT